MTPTTSRTGETEGVTVTEELLDSWATDPTGPVALHLKQKLLPIEGEGGVIFPPTYVDIGYNIDELADGTKVATIDSVGSQANRMEPIFKAAPKGQPENPLAKLVPQIAIKVNDSLEVSIFDVGHRLGDALVRSTELSGEAKRAFEAVLNGDATQVAKLAPTSLVFGVWDSRETSAKLPRIVQSVIRAWDVQKLTRAAQYNPPLDYSALEVFSGEEKAKAEGNTKSPLAQRGFVHVPSVKNPGGVVARGRIERDVTINLVALRRLRSAEKTDELRRYVLGLSLIAATEPLDGFLRQGCLLTADPASPSDWTYVGRDGSRPRVALPAALILKYAEGAAKKFKVGESRSVAFEKARAKKDLEDEKTTKGKKGAGKRERGTEPSASAEAADGA